MSVPFKVKIKRFLLNTQFYKYAKRRYRKLMKETDNKICAVPWMHLNFEPNGKVVPCCLTSTYNYFAGDLTHQTIDQIWNSDNMKKLRVQMMNNEEPEICRKCFDKERVTGESGRVYHNREFKSVLKKIPIITEKDGTCNEMKLKYWDFRFSNLCNFKCRSCGPRYSSAWVPDAKKLGYTDQEKVWNIDAVGQQTNYDFLKDQVQHVEKIYFAGGEPLLMPEHWQILDMLVEGKRFDVKLSYNTNCSVLEYGKKNVLDYWSQWDYGKLEIWPSIDEIGARAELVRSGTIWSKVEENLIAMTKLDNLIVRPGLTIGAMNVFRLPEIIDKLLELGVIKEKLWYKNFFINLLEQPSYYHVHILPDEFKDSIIERINGYIEEYNKKYSTDIGPHFAQIIHELKKPHNPKDAIKFLRTSYQVDQVRDESIFETIPELECLRSMYPGKYR